MLKKIQLYREPLAVFALFYVFFLFLLAQNFSGPHDSIEYLNGILGKGPLANQHHLLYHYAAYCWYHFWHYLLPGVRAYYVVEAFSAFWGSAGLAVIYLFFRNRFGFSGLRASLSVLVVAFTYGFWFYSINIEVYTPPLFFIFSCLYLLSQKSISQKEWYLIFLFHSLAILFHQINILFLPVIAIRLWQLRKQTPWFAWMFRYAVIGVLLVGSTYFVAGWFVEKQNTSEKWITWILGYAKEGGYWEPLSAKTPVNAAVGFGHAFFGGHFVFQLAPVKKILSSSLSSHSLGDEIFVSQNISANWALLLTILCVLQVVLMAVLLIRFLFAFKSAQKAYPETLLVVITTFFIYSGFFLFWVPEILEFWIMQTVLFWLLVLGTFNTSIFGRIKPLPLTALAAFLLFMVNYFGTIKWMQDFNNDLYYKKVTVVKQNAQKGDFVLLQDKWIMGGFLQYFTDLDIDGVPSGDSSRIPMDTRIKEQLEAHKRVLLLTETGVTQPISRDSRYMDSLRVLYHDRIRMLNKEVPAVWVIE